MKRPTYEKILCELPTIEQLWKRKTAANSTLAIAATATEELIKQTKKQKQNDKNH